MVAKRLELQKSYKPLAPQERFHRSLARIRAYGGAMGGGKSRAICEECFRLAMEYPGLPVLIGRQRHTSIIETTRKTMFDHVIPVELLEHCRIKTSAGEDFVEFPNRSVIHFIGLEDPIKWFSSEIGVLAFDEAHEVLEDTVVKLMSRLRFPRAPVASSGDTGLVLIGFNPENPGHWLQRWMIVGSEQTEFGFRKNELWLEGAEGSQGDVEFVFARAADNPYLPPGYVENTLGGMPEMLRRRYKDGEWVYTSGKCFFDLDALGEYAHRVERPRWLGYTAGADARLAKRLRREGRTVDLRAEGKIRVSGPHGGPALPPEAKGAAGPWCVWEAPIRERFDKNTGRSLPANRYVVSVDASSGEATDFAAIQVVCVETLAQVAEYQAKVDPDLLALEAYRIGRVYNDALVVPEITGGWGFTIVRELERLGYGRLYTRPVQDRLRKQWTDKLGWDTTSKTRAVMLDTLERVLREREFELRGERTLAELLTFVRDKDGRPAAQPGCCDDLVVTIAIAATICDQMPRQLRRVREEKYQPAFAATGY